jgi:biofilm PGA synthesis lipoprotein PgaB
MHASLIRAAVVLLALVATLASTPAQAALLVLSYHDIRDDVARRGDPDPYAVSTQNFAAHLDWLHGNGYTAVDLDDLVAASRGERALPDRAVLITFDDGLRSAYTHAFPLLRAYGFPAVVAPVTGWVDLPPDARVNYAGPASHGHDDFLTWSQLREMQASGLVEVASHTHGLHYGALANPQGNTIPAAVTRILDLDTGHYETRGQYQARIRADLATSSATIARELGRPPRAVIWPYAAYNQQANAIADDLGLAISFDLEGPQQAIGADLHGLARLLVMDNPTVPELVRELRDPADDGGAMRAIQVDLDYVYDPDPGQTERNLDVLVERIHRIHPTDVFLQAFADPDGDGAADALYFPNRHLPMRADLFNRVAWQLATRAQVRVYAWLPVLAYRPDRAAALAIPGADPAEVFRLDPSNPRVRALVSDIYEDLAIASPISGLHFHDDALLREGELPGLFPGDPAARTRYLIDFTRELHRAAERWRPKLETSRNLFARPVLEPASEAWFAQSLAAFVPAYDHTVVMAMPWMEGSDAPRAWLDRLVARVKAQPGALDRVVLQLQTVDWDSEVASARFAPAGTLPQTALRLQAAGVRHLAYYPDDFLRDRPHLDVARETISARSFPYPED